MKNFLLTFLSVLLIHFFGFSQCIPDTDFTGILGLPENAVIIADTTGLNITNPTSDPTALPHATVGEPYETFFNMRIPADTVITYDIGNGPQLFDPVYVTTIAINSVQGLPMSFDWECASQAPDGDDSGAEDDMDGDGIENGLDPDIDGDGILNDEDDFPYGYLDTYNCVFPGGGYGCVRLYSDAVDNVVGTYPLLVSLDIAAEYEVFGIMIPVEVTDESLLNYLVLIVDEGNNSSIGEIVDSRQFKGLGTYPNPFGESTTIHFGNNNSNNVKFSVFDVLGNLVYTDNIDSKIGHNEYDFNKGLLKTGLYTYTLYNGSKTISERVFIY